MAAPVARDDELEHQVESTEAAAPIRDEDQPKDQPPKKKKGDAETEEPPHLDVTA